ncbi:nucleoside deaminase [Halobacillus faecis]|uniref:tRNA-specific adenosine deaminase n=1 Tax=Halobacillus faecis TaxID=360184 RepID=A0A511WTD4_9BACI|nr:nucleoside deaminase [Halobacillus faecis]GEN53548.1 tRNA-specific adenosine deaminase [Halobacillus faecis]
MNPFSERALQLALENVNDGGHPFGAVLVCNGEIIAEGVNELHLHPDVSAHAEMVAIKKAQQARGSIDLSDCTMYASGEPCAMCLTAMYFSNLKKVIYSQSVEEASRVGLTLSEKVYQDLQKTQNQREITMIHEPIENSELDAMHAYAMKKG